MASFQITDDQKSFFDEYGFLVFRHFFSPREMETIASEAQSTFDESIIGLVVDMLEWYADTGWHRDLDVPGNTGLKFIYYMEPLTAESGSLRVVPGSHIEPHETEIPDIEPLRIAADADGNYMEMIRGLEIQPGEVMLRSVAVETRPGDAIAFAMPLLHAAFGGRRGRRFGAIIYGIRPLPKSRQMVGAGRRPLFAATMPKCSTTPKTGRTATPTGSPARRGIRFAHAGSNACAILSGSGIDPSS